MSAVEPLPLPPELAVDAEPLTDADLADYFGDAEALANEAALDFDAAMYLLRESATDSPVHRAARWRIEADDQAEWALRKMAVAQDELRVMVQQRDEYVARIDAWLDRVSKGCRRTVAFMEQQLEDYAVRRRAAGGGATLVLPAGIIATTYSRPAVEVDDDDAVAAYVEVRLMTPPPDASDEACDRFRTWREALEDAEVSQADVVRRSAKVYVGPLRKLVTIGEQTVGQRVKVTLECGHVIDSELPEDEKDVPEVSEFVVCTRCDPDPIDGPPERPVSEVVRYDEVEPIVLGPDGQPVPGATVRPEKITPRVEPGGF